MMPTEPEHGGSRRLWWLVLACLLGAILGTLAIKSRGIWEPPIAELAPAPASCDLRRGACTARFADGGRVSLLIEPTGIPLVKPLRLRALLQDMPPAPRVEVDFRGVDMDMGLNRFALEATAQPGAYQGTGMLPLCARQRMRWEARVLLFWADATRAAAFRFDTQRPR